MSNVRTIYAWTSGANQNHGLMAENLISPLIMQYKHGLVSDDTDITPKEAPDSLKIFSAMSVNGFGELFFDTRYTGENEQQRDFSDVLNVSGMTLVSEAMRDAIQKVDPNAQHEFVPTLVFDNSGKKISKKDYFHFWCRTRAYSSAEKSDFKYQSTLRPKDSFSFIFRSHAASLCLADLPIWMYQANTSYFFMSSETYSALSSQELIGLNEFTEPGGRYRKLADGTELNRLENVGHIHVPLTLDK